jgi:hypothetical protein
MRAQTIQIFLPKGEPRGIRQAEITTKTVRVFDVPRGDLSSLPADIRINVPGIYFLVGAEQDIQRVYVGESDNVKNRLVQHLAGKDFWDRALIAVSLTDSWTKAHVQFLEHAAIDAANKSRQYKVENSQGGRLTNVPTPLKADCEEYFETIEVLISTLGYPILDVPRAGADVPATRSYFLTRNGSNARGVYENGAITVLAGSSFTFSEAKNPYGESILKRQRRLIDEGVLDGAEKRFLVSHTFQTPSGAADVVLGKSSNGWVEWRDSTGAMLTERRQEVAPSSSEEE